MDSQETLALREILNTKVKTRKELMRIKRQVAKKFALPIFNNAKLISEYRRLLRLGDIKQDINLENVLRKRAIRTMSGIAPVAVLTKPYPCPGRCAYCPTEKDVPQSYLSNEPAVMRAIRCGYNPYEQVDYRLRALEANGHNPTKIELIVIGGTWSYLPIKYKYWYIANLFAAANQFSKQKKEREKQKYSIRLSLVEMKKALLKEQKKNEKTKYQIIGLTLETRPDYINEKELLEMREFGCTRVEIGVQAIDDNILKFNRRGHGVAEIIQATELLRSFGFKITYHLMPGLPSATPKRDLEMFKQLFSDKNFQPDQIKFYPTVVTKGSLMHRWWKQGKYEPYTTEILEDLIIACKKVVPPYTRIIRLIRDIPGESILAGNLVTNLRQVLLARGVKCSCIRCREIKDEKVYKKDVKKIVRTYEAGLGQEYFISFETKKDKLLGFVRLYLPNNTEDGLGVLKNSAIIRELHVYGQLVSRGEIKKVQHSGLGSLLMKEAEKIVKKNKFKKIAVISGVGVRNYYRKFGYKLKETYMKKSL